MLNIKLTNPDPPLTPCIGVCTMDKDGLCLGCRRTSHEITIWSRLDNRERARIMSEELPKRVVCA